MTTHPWSTGDRDRGQAPRWRTGAGVAGGPAGMGAMSGSPADGSIGGMPTGLGPLAPLLADPTVTDVMVNGPADVWVERGGAIERAAVRFASAAAVAALVQRVVAPLGLRVDESRPWVDARLPGGERFHAVLPPLAPDGPVVTIRTFARRRLQLRDLVDRNALDAATARLLEAMVAAGIAIAVSGATGTGKTTLLNVLAAVIPAQERVVTIEDLAELWLPGPHVVRLEARPPNVEGRGRCRCANWSATPFGCGPTGSWSARSGVPRCWTCCRPPTPVTAVS
ncbi:MAG TPA: ATPase, T2SS/T4P/T4SS family [Actinomycetota bacterium]|nr:ATPase, T2SS/T4P/T4SS family [Actinomycetota bacterium]